MRILRFVGSREKSKRRSTISRKSRQPLRLNVRLSLPSSVRSRRESLRSRDKEMLWKLKLKRSVRRRERFRGPSKLRSEQPKPRKTSDCRSNNKNCSQLSRMPTSRSP